MVAILGGGLQPGVTDVQGLNRRFNDLTNHDSLLRKRLRQRDGFEHGFALVHRFLKFRFGFGVIHPATAGLHVGFAVLEQRNMAI